MLIRDISFFTEAMFLNSKVTKLTYVASLTLLHQYIIPAPSRRFKFISCTILFSIVSHFRLKMRNNVGLGIFFLLFTQFRATISAPSVIPGITSRSEDRGENVPAINRFLPVNARETTNFDTSDVIQPVSVDQEETNKLLPRVDSEEVIKEGVDHFVKQYGTLIEKVGDGGGINPFWAQQGMTYNVKAGLDKIYDYCKVWQDQYVELVSWGYRSPYWRLISDRAFEVTKAWKPHWKQVIKGQSSTGGSSASDNDRTPLLRKPQTDEGEDDAYNIYRLVVSFARWRHNTEEAASS